VKFRIWDGPKIREFDPCGADPDRTRGLSIGTRPNWGSKRGCRQEKTKLFSVKVETCLVEKILIILFHFRKKIDQQDLKT
jgi:hypothetical protein